MSQGPFGRPDSRERGCAVHALAPAGRFTPFRSGIARAGIRNSGWKPASAPHNKPCVQLGISRGCAPAVPQRVNKHGDGRTRSGAGWKALGHTVTLALGSPENQEAGSMLAVLENQLATHLSACVLGHHHDVRRIARFGRKACFCGPFCKSVECVRETRRVPALIRADLNNDF